MLIPPSDDPRDLASEARHGGRVILNQEYYNARGWRSGLEDDPAYVPQVARIMSGRGQPPPYIREWREPGWPIYRAAIRSPDAERADVELAMAAGLVLYHYRNNHDLARSVEELGRALDTVAEVASMNLRRTLATSQRTSPDT